MKEKEVSLTRPVVEEGKVLPAQPIAEANARGVLPTVGTRVRLFPRSEAGLGSIVHERHIRDRRKPPGTYHGTYLGYVGGAGGDVWWVEHDDKTVGAYMSDEVRDVE